MNTYTKLQTGAWGVRASGKVENGSAVTVTKKDGTTKVETVEKVIWTGKDSKTGQAISPCAISQTGNGYSHRPGTCVNCGDPCNPRYRRCLDCVDGGSNAHGGQSYYDRRGHFVLGDDD